MLIWFLNQEKFILRWLFIGLIRQKAAYVDFSQISCPVLVISGTKDKMTHPNIARRTAKNYRDSVLVSLTGADHMYESGKFQQKTLKVIKGWSQQNGFVD